MSKVGRPSRAEELAVPTLRRCPGRFVPEIETTGCWAFRDTDEQLRRHINGAHNRYMLTGWVRRSDEE